MNKAAPHEGLGIKVGKEVSVPRALGQRQTALGDFPGGTVVKNPPAMQGTRVRALVREDPTYRGATKPVCHNY